MQNIGEYIEQVDAIITTELSNPVSDAAFYELVKVYQVHHHHKSCKKYKNDKCQFHFGRFFTDRAIISCPLSTDLTSSRRKDILNKIEPKSIKEILNLLDTSEDRYYEALKTAEENDFQINFWRPPRSASLLIILRQVQKHGMETWIHSQC